MVSDKCIEVQKLGMSGPLVSLVRLRIGANVIKLFKTVIYREFVISQAECVALTGLSSLV